MTISITIDKSKHEREVYVFSFFSPPFLVFDRYVHETREPRKRKWDTVKIWNRIESMSRGYFTNQKINEPKLSEEMKALVLQKLFETVQVIQAEEWLAKR